MHDVHPNPALTEASGAVTEQNSYDSFGNQTNTSFSSRYQYTGREYDPLSGFYYYRARWYDAKIGRFVSEDPIGFGGGDINYYGYVGNNAPNLNDPSGEFPSFFRWNYHKTITERALGGRPPSRVAALANEQYPFGSVTHRN